VPICDNLVQELLNGHATLLPRQCKKNQPEPLFWVQAEVRKCEITKMDAPELEKDQTKGKKSERRHEPKIRFGPDCTLSKMAARSVFPHYEDDRD
jgi:hypothetical protein